MTPTICQCCGWSMGIARGRNPNVCRDCDTLLLDDSPERIALQTSLPQSELDCAGSGCASLERGRGEGTVHPFQNTPTLIPNLSPCHSTLLANEPHI